MARASAPRRAAEEATPLRFDNEQRARIEDCLRKEALSLSRDRLERFVGGIEASAVRFLAAHPRLHFGMRTTPRGTFGSCVTRTIHRAANYGRVWGPFPIRPSNS
jgi:hypothetical protein